MQIKRNRPISIYQRLGWFRIYLDILSGVLRPKRDDIVEYILGILAEFATKINVVSTINSLVSPYAEGAPRGGKDASAGARGAGARALHAAVAARARGRRRHRRHGQR